MLPIAVQTQGLSRRFDLHFALRDLSLTLPTASALLVVGPNGAGKPPLLRLLATALRPSAGRATVFGHDLVRGADAVRQITAYVGTAHGMYEGLTAKENLAFAATMGGRPDQADAVLKRVGLFQVAHKSVRTFSHGMKRRLALARAWMLAPRLLLLDDPFSGLDAEGTLLVDTLVAEVKSPGGGARPGKALVREGGGRGTIPAMAVLALLVVLLLGFALGAEPPRAPAILWVALALAAMLGVARPPQAEGGKRAP